jgi:DNA-binding transcriptional ArsR family regulator
MPTFDRGTERVAEILKTIAHPLRLRILALLCAQDESVGAMAARLGAKQTAVSQALSIMRHERLVAVTRRNRHATYRIEEPALRQLIPRIVRTPPRVTPDERRLAFEASARDDFPGPNSVAPAGG